MSMSALTSVPLKEANLVFSVLYNNYNCISRK